MATNTTSTELPTKLDRSHELIYVQTTFLVLAGLCVLLRVYVKAVIVRHQALDDFLIYGAMIGYTAYGAIAIDGAINGATGKHIATGYTMPQAARSLRGWYLCMAIYAPVTLTIRASVCVLLLRLSTSKHFKRLVYANLILIAIISTAFFFIAIFQCSPPTYFWMQVLGSKGYCHNKLIITYATTVHSALSAASDWCLGLMPIALLWNVKINRRTKATVAFLLSLGMIAGVALIVRIPYVTRLPPGLDFLYKSLDVAVWSVLEPALGIIAACFATFRPLFKNWGFGWKTANASPSGHIPLSGDGTNPRRQCWDGTGSSQQPRHRDGSGISSGDEPLNSSIELKKASSVNETIYTKAEAHARDVERGRVNAVVWRDEDSDK